MTDELKSIIANTTMNQLEMIDGNNGYKNAIVANEAVAMAKEIIRLQEGQEKKMNVNLYAQIKNDKVTGLIMPDSLGQMTANPPEGKDWYGVQWPLNPHFTGETVITMMLEANYPHREPVTV